MVEGSVGLMKNFEIRFDTQIYYKNYKIQIYTSTSQGRDPILKFRRITKDTNTPITNINIYQFLAAYPVIKQIVEMYKLKNIDKEEVIDDKLV